MFRRAKSPIFGAIYVLLGNFGQLWDFNLTIKSRSGEIFWEHNSFNYGSIIGNAPPFLSELSSGDMPIACGPFAVILASFIISWSMCPFVSPNQPEGAFSSRVVRKIVRKRPGI